MKLPFKKSKNLTAILGSFEKTLADLNTLIAGNTDRIIAIDANISALTEESDVLADEVQKAERVSARIKELVS